MRTRIEALTAKPFWIAALSAFLLAAAGAVAPKAWTQETVTEPLTPAQLEELVGPVALYPDELLAIILPAATYPLDIVEAARFLEARKSDPSLEPDEDWDDSIVALLNYPEIVDFLNEDLDWTWTLGEAVLDDQAAVLDATQAFRQRAYAAGNLASDEHQIVTNKDGFIEITPVDQKVVYVPYYEPRQVVVRQPRRVYSYYPYAYPVYYYPYPVGYNFGLGYFWGVTSAFTIGWNSHFLHVYAPTYFGHPFYGYSYYTPYYYRRGVNVTINVNNHDHVWRPRNTRGARPYDGYRARGDNGRTRTYDGRRYRYSEGGGLANGGVAQRPRPADKSGTRLSGGSTGTARSGPSTARTTRSGAAPSGSTRSGTADRSGSARDKNARAGTSTETPTQTAPRTRSAPGTSTTPRLQRQDRAQLQSDAQTRSRGQTQSGVQTRGRPLTQSRIETQTRTQPLARAQTNAQTAAPTQPRTVRQPRTGTTERVTRGARMGGIDSSVSGRPVQPRQYTAPSTARQPQTSRPVSPQPQYRSAPATPQRQYSAPAQRAPVQRSAPAPSQRRSSAPAAPRQSAPAAPSRSQAAAPSSRSAPRGGGGQRQSAPTRSNKGGRSQR